MLIPVLRLNDTDVIQPAFVASGAFVGAPAIGDIIQPAFVASGAFVGLPAIIGIAPPVRATSQGATWQYVLGGGGGGVVANDEIDEVSRWRTDRDDFVEHLKTVRKTPRRAARRWARPRPSLVKREPEWELGDFADYADYIAVGDDTPTVGTLAHGTITGGELAGYVAAGIGAFGLTYALSSLCRDYLESRHPSAPSAVAPLGIAGLVAISAVAFHFHRLPVAIGAGLAALVVALQRQSPRSNPSKKGRSRRKRRRGKTSR